MEEQRRKARLHLERRRPTKTGVLQVTPRKRKKAAKDDSDEEEEADVVKAELESESD